MEAPFCVATTSLDALDYDWPCDFARFESAIWNPGRYWSRRHPFTLGWRH
ncbi:hypothetical protein ACIG54_35730 [Streptomyces achromogenes]